MFFSGPAVVAVTSTNNKRWYGRYLTRHGEEPTSGVHKDITGVFPTMALAFEAVGKVQEIRERHEPAIEQAQRELSKAKKLAYAEEQSYLATLNANGGEVR